MSRIQTHIMAGMLLLAGCSVAPPRMASGYVEGDYVYVAAPEGGWITEVLVSRGQSVKPGDALFSLDSDTQLARRDQARAQLDQALSQLADATKSRRPDEVDALEALQSQSRAALTLADSNYSRATDLKKRGFVAQSFLDARRADRDTAAQALRQASANLALARK